MLTAKAIVIYNGPWMGICKILVGRRTAYALSCTIGGAFREHQKSHWQDGWMKSSLTGGWWRLGDGLHYFLWPLREQEGKEGGDEWRWVVPAARTAGEAHSGLPACLIYSAGRALCTPHHLPFCPLAVLLLSIVDAEKVRGHRTDTGVAHIWLSVGVLYFDGESTRDVA